MHRLTHQLDLDDEEAIRIGEQLILVNFPPDYSYAISKAEILATISTVTDARTRLTREQLEADLPTLSAEASSLAKVILGATDVELSVHDIYEKESGLQYWLVSVDGTKQLLGEWIRIFQSCPYYLTLAPFDVQEMMEGLQSAPIEVQRRALQTTFSSALPAAKRSRKRSHKARDVELEYVTAKRLEVDSDNTKSEDATAGYNLINVVRGRKASRWSRGKLNACEKIKGIQVSELPYSVFDQYRNELESSCTPVAADIRLCNFPVSIEEVLTVSIRSPRAWS